MKVIIKSVLKLLLIFLPFLLNAQPPDYCSGAQFDEKLNRVDPKIIIHAAKTPRVVTLLPGCDLDTFPDDTFRYIGFVHGLGGNNSSWDKQAEFTQLKYAKTSDAISYSGFETSFFTAAKRLNKEIYDYMDASINSSRPNRCKEGDFVICHSQGGLVARYLDSAWNVDDVNYGLRKFSGIVTFGTPNGGADIAFSKEQHKEFVQKMISSIVLHSVNETMNDVVKGTFGIFVGNKILAANAQLDTFIKNTLAPLTIASFHTNTLDEMKPSSSLLKSLNYHNTGVHRVAFYGIENEPECWRIMDNILTKKSEEYELWGANIDQEFVDKAEEIRLAHIQKKGEEENSLRKVQNSMNIPAWGMFRSFFGGEKKLLNLISIIDKRDSSISFFNNANTQWRFLIGSLHKDSFVSLQQKEYRVTWQEKVTTKVKYLLIFTKTKEETKSKEFTTKDSVLAANFLNDLSAQIGNRFITGYVFLTIKIVKKRKLFLSDGIVLAKSQIAFTDVKLTDILLLKENNHMQMRNSSETKRVLEMLYEGRSALDPFFKIKFWD